jgi:hypothetical protein
MDNLEQEIIEPTEPVAEEAAEPVAEAPLPEKEIPYTKEEIEEWRLGAMRQADYSRKTAEVAQQRREAEEALKVYNLLQENPELIDVLSEAYQGKQGGTAPKITTQIEAQLSNVQQQLANIELDKELLSLQKRYPDFDEAKVIQYAATHGLADLEIAYRASRDIDEKSVREKILSELKQNNESTTSLIGNYGGKGKTSSGLSSIEKSYAQKLGMTEDEYAKWKN